MKRYSNYSMWVWAVIAIVALLSIVANFGVWPTCDDVDYGLAYREYYNGNLLYYPRWILRHWVVSNGRAANFFAPMWLYFLPYNLVRIVSGLMVGAMLAMIVRMGCPQWREKPLHAIALLFCAVFALTWWDGMMMFDFAFNYVWAAALGLFSVWLILHRLKPGAVTGLAAMATLIGGMMHESMSAPLVAGLVIWGLLNGQWRKMSRSNRIVFGAFVFGAFVAFISPGIWMRATKGFQPDDPVLPLLLKSDYIALALTLALIVTGIVKPASLKELLRGKVCIWIVAAVSAMAFSAVGGIVGRSGWFANIYALIAFALWIKPCQKQPKWLAAILGLVIIAEYAALAYWQLKRGNELAEVIALYQQSPDGNVFYDFTDDPDVPVLTFHRTRGVPDADDYYTLSSLTKAYGDSLRPLAVLPTSVQHLQPWQAEGGLQLPGEVTATLQCPDAARALGVWREQDGTEMVVTPLMKNDTIIYVIQKRDRDPGDRDFNLLPRGYVYWKDIRLKMLR